MKETHQLLKNTTIHLHLGLSAFPQILVVVLEAFPMGVELLQAVGVDIFDPAPISPSPPQPQPLHSGGKKTYTVAAQRVTFLPSFIHSNSPRPFASLLHFI